MKLVHQYIVILGAVLSSRFRVLGQEVGAKSYTVIFVNFIALLHLVVVGLIYFGGKLIKLSLSVLLYMLDRNQISFVETD